MRRKIIAYNPKLKQLARNLRKRMTLSEILLWSHLRKRQMGGYQFLRQKPIGNFIVDFFCKELTLAIEIDGESHDEKIEQDEQRQKKLESLGIRILRFHDQEVKNNLDGVLTAIGKWIRENERDSQ